MTDVENPDNAKKIKKNKKKQPDFFSVENLRSLGLLIVVIFAIRWSVASPYHVPTASMEPTIKVGDRLLAFKLSYDFKVPFTNFSLINWAKPKRGDIIVFRYPRDPEIDYVKRVVAVAGDTVEVINDVLFVNGKEQQRVDFNHDRSILSDIDDIAEHKLLYKEAFNGDEHWVLQNSPETRPLSNRNFGPRKIPEDTVFCMGDNRDNSTDSRIWGEVHMSHIRGKALFVLWSIHSKGTWDFSLRVSRFGHSLYSL